MSAVCLIIIRYIKQFNNARLNVLNNGCAHIIKGNRCKNINNIRIVFNTLTIGLVTAVIHRKVKFPVSWIKKIFKIICIYILFLYLQYVYTFLEYS